MDTQWCAPEDCALTAADQPARMAEWDGLLADAEIDVQPLPQQVRLQLHPSAATVAADLAIRESQCCSFLTFTFTVSKGSLTLDVTSDADHRDLLDVLASRVTSMSALRQ